MELDAYFDDFERRDWDTGIDGTVRFAMVGLGWWTREQAIPAVEESEYCETTAVVSGSQEKADSVADEFDVGHALTYNQFEGGDSADAFDAVYICTPNATHFDLCRAAATHGKAVLCEKPVEATAERAEALVDACSDAGVELMVAYRMQTEPAVRRARELIRDGFIGTPVQAHGADSATLLSVIPDPDQWRLDPDSSGGCALIDLGVYPLNTLRFLLDADPERVSGTTRSPTDAFADVDEHVTFTLEFPETVATCTASHNAYESAHLSVLGTEGRLSLDPVFHPWDPPVLTLERGNVRLSGSGGQVNQMTEEFDYFAHCLMTGTSPEADGEHALVDAHAVDAIYRSASDGGRPVQL